MIYTIKSIAPVCAQLHESGKQIVLATGFFDLLHSEHQSFLQSAKNHGDILIVAVESDSRARAIKGEDRPVQTQSLRCENILSNNLADYVIALGDDFNNFEAYDSFMAAVKPIVYAVSEGTSHPKSKQFLVEKYGGKLVVVHKLNPDISTTKIINHL